MASKDYPMELQKDRDRICTSVREQYVQITAKLASDLLEQFRTSNAPVFENKAAPSTLIPPTTTKTCNVGVQTEPESITLSKRGPSSETVLEHVSSTVNLQNTIEQLQAQLARRDAELVRAHSIARALEANLHQRETHLRNIEADYDTLRAEKDMYLRKSFYLEFSHDVDTETLKNANAEVARLREEIHNFHQPSSLLYQSIKNAVERKAKGLAPLSPEFLGVTSLEKSAILDVHTESTTVPPPSPNGHIPSSNQPTSRQQNDPVTPAVTTQNRSQTSISIPKGPVRPGPLFAPAVVSAPKAMYTPPIDDGHLPQHQYHAHRVPKRISTVPVITNGPHAQGHIMNYIHATTHQIPHQTSVNRVPPVPASQPPLPPQPTNHSVSSTNPTPQPVEGQRHSIGIPITCGDPIADNIFSGLWKSEFDARHQFISSGCKGCHLKLGKDQLLNYQAAFDHSSSAHPEEWHKCCQWIVARAGELAQTLTQTAPRV